MTYQPLSLVVRTGRVAAFLHLTVTLNAPDAPRLPLAVAMPEYSRLVTFHVHAHLHKYCIYTHLLLQTVINSLDYLIHGVPRLLPSSPAAHTIGEMATTFEEEYEILSWTRDSGLSLSVYNLNGEDYSHGQFVCQTRSHLPPLHLL